MDKWGPHRGLRKLTLTDDMRYYKDGMYSFDIIDFEYSKKSNKIFFVKLSNLSMDFGKRFKNTLYILNSNLINGVEDGYEIKYKRFYVPKVDFDFLVGHWKNQMDLMRKGQISKFVKLPLTKRILYQTNIFSR